MAQVPKRHFWRTCRIYFRRFRILVWLLVLSFLGAALYLNQIGLPGFVKRPLLDRLRARGLDLEFSRLRLRWYQGIVAEDVRFGSAEGVSSPRLTVREVQVRLNWQALRHLQWQVDSLVLREGRLIWPVATIDHPGRELAVERIQTELRLLPNDQWALDHFRAAFAGAGFELSGVVTNASAVRDWKKYFPSEPSASAPAGTWQHRLSRLADHLERIRFASPPELRVEVHGDARDPRSFAVQMRLAAPDATTPWGVVSQGRVSARLFPATNSASRAEVNLAATSTQTRWGSITNLLLGIRLNTADAGLVHGDLTLSTRYLTTAWGWGSNAQFAAQWTHTLTNPIPLEGHARLQCPSTHTRWGSGRNLDLEARLVDSMSPAQRPAPMGELPPTSAWAWWTNLDPFVLSWTCHLADLQAADLAAEEMASSGLWSAPDLTVSNLQVKAYQGQLAARAGFNVASRRCRAEISSNLDPKGVSPLLPEAARRWLGQFTWEKAPQLQGQIGVTLPLWTNSQPDWRGETLPTLVLDGEFSLPSGGTFRGLHADQAHSHILYSNRCWHLPDLTVIRTDGRLEAVHRADERTGEFYWRFSSNLDPEIARPLLSTNEQRVFQLFTLTQPPILEAEIRGRAREPERIGLQATVALTNFVFRGQDISSLQASLRFTNRCLEVFAPRLQRGTQHAHADGLMADFNRDLVFLTNAFSTLEPMVVARAIGPHIARAILPYQFLQPPTARVHGAIPMHGEQGADLHFFLDGGPFEWWKFHLPHVGAHVHWSGQHLTLSNVVADAYEGQIRGSASFDFQPTPGTDFAFELEATNLLFQALMADLTTSTNHLEGRLSTSLSVTRANTEDWRTVFGYGDATLRDGLIWDIPIFGFLSPILNGITPGLGNIRATAATCTFLITNGVVCSDDLEIRAPALRLQYRGTTDLESRVNARVEAELLRDVWLVGPLVSTVFWPVTKLFEYKVTGTLDEPKADPVFLIPKLVLMPFHPFRTLKSLLPDGSSSRTNPPAKR